MKGIFPHGTVVKLASMSDEKEAEGSDTEMHNVAVNIINYGRKQRLNEI